MFAVSEKSTSTQRIRKKKSSFVTALRYFNSDWDPNFYAVHDIYQIRGSKSMLFYSRKSWFLIYIFISSNSVQGSLQTSHYYLFPPFFQKNFYFSPCFQKNFPFFRLNQKSNYFSLKVNFLIERSTFLFMAEHSFFWLKMVLFDWKCYYFVQKVSFLLGNSTMWLTHFFLSGLKNRVGMKIHHLVET